MVELSIFIPVYRESDTLNSLLEKLINDPFQNKEIHAIMEEPTKKTLELLNIYSSEVNFIINKVRKGKAKALNDAVQFSNGDVLLFLDSDVSIPDSNRDFLERIVSEMKHNHIIEIKKKAMDGPFVSRISGYDYLSFSMTNLYFSKVLHKCIGLSGAAFAIKKTTFQELGGFSQEISEDMDIALKTFVKNKKYKFMTDLEVLTKSPCNWREWFRQRKRWALGSALWFKKNYKIILKNLIKYPNLLAGSLFYLFPSLIMFLINLVLSATLSKKIFLTSLLFFQIKFTALSPLIFLLFSYITLIKGILLYLVSFFISSIVFYFIAKNLNYEFKLSEFAFYFFIYSPLWTIISLEAIFKVLIHSEYKGDNLSWKT